MAQRLPAWRTELLAEQARKNAPSPVLRTSSQDISELYSTIAYATTEIYGDLISVAEATEETRGVVAAIIPALARLVSFFAPVEDADPLVVDPRSPIGRMLAAQNGRLDGVEAEVGQVKSRLQALEQTTSEAFTATQSAFAALVGTNAVDFASAYQQLAQQTNLLRERTLP